MEFARFSPQRILSGPESVRRSRWFLTAAVMLIACGPRPGTQLPVAGLFREASAETGLSFHHFNGATGDFFMPEIVGPGVALIDYDGDGDLDVLLVQGDFVEPGHQPSDATFPPP